MTAEWVGRQRSQDAAVALALAIGGGAVIASRGAAVLAPAEVCPGALEAAAIALAHLGRSSPLGPWLLTADRVLAIVAVVLFGFLARRASGAWVAAASTALAFANQSPFAPRLSVFGPASFVVAASVFLALTRRHSGPGVDWRLWLGLLLSAAVSPNATLPLAIVAALHVGAADGVPRATRRLRSAVVAGAALVTWIAVLEAVMPGGPPTFRLPLACLVPPVASGIGTAGVLRSMLSAPGVLACSLAALGAFALRGALRERRTWTMMAYAAASVVVSGIAGGSANFIAPAMVAFWVLASVGLADAMRACGTTVGGRVAATSLIVLLPVLQISARANDLTASDRVPLQRQESLTLQDVAHTLRILPDDSALVAEDATFELFLRALDGSWQRAGKRLQLLPRRAADVAAVLSRSGTHVFARPAAQSYLWKTGFQLSEIQDAPGVSEVFEGGACTVLDKDWRSLTGFSRSSMMTLAADADREEGPILVYFGGDQALMVRTLDWPPLTLRGFHVRSYDREEARDRTRLEASMREDNLPAASAVLNARYLTRLELWRTPGAPHLLTIDLGATPATSTARVGANAPVPRVTVCPSFPPGRDAMPGSVRP